MRLKRNAGVASTVLVLVVGACGSDLKYGFDEYRTCADGNESCVEVKVRSAADRYPHEVVSETDTKVRIRLFAEGLVTEEVNLGAQIILLV